MGPPISLHMISTHHARRNTHTHTRRNANATAGLALQAQRCAPDFARAPLAEVADKLRVCFWLSRNAFCLLFVEVESVRGSPTCFCMTLMHHVQQNDGIFVFRCTGRMRHVSTKRSLHDVDTQCITTVFELHVLFHRSNGSCVHQTFFARCWYTMYNNSLRSACFVV